jgi:hypothetical protein
MSPIPMRSSPSAFYSRSHEHFLLGRINIRFLDFHQPHDRPELGATGQLHVAAGSICDRKRWRGRNTSISARNA